MEYVEPLETAGVTTHPRHIVMLAAGFPPEQINGLATHISHLSHALARLGNVVSVLTVGSRPGYYRSDVGTLRVHRFGPPFPIPRAHYLQVANDNTCLLAASLSSESTAHVDVIHAHDWVAAPAALALAGSLSVPLVTTLHAPTRDEDAGGPSPLDDYRFEWEDALLRASVGLIAVSDHVRSVIARQHTLSQDRIVTIPNGVEPSHLSESDRLAAPGHGCIVLFVGRLVERKGVQHLIDALPLILARSPEIQLRIVGDGHYREALEEKVRRLDLSAQVEFVGLLYGHELAREYAAASVVVVPSESEGFGLVALEAMAAGAPLIVTAVGGLAEWTTHEQNVLQVPARNARAIAEAVLRILHDPALERRLRSAGLVLVAKYGWPEIAQRTADLYLDACRTFTGRLTNAIRENKAT